MDGITMQEHLTKCQVVSEARMTEQGASEWLYLRLGEKLVPLGTDKGFADCLVFACVRNAVAFDQANKAWHRVDELTRALCEIAELPTSRSAEAPEIANNALVVIGP